MSCEAFIETANENVTVDSGGFVPLGQVVHYSCHDCELEGSAIVCKGRGAFEVQANLTVSQVDTSGSTPPVLSAGLYRNGEKLTGSTAAANSNGTVNLSLRRVVRNDTCVSSTVAVKIEGPAVNVENIECMVRRLG